MFRSTQMEIMTCIALILVVSAALSTPFVYLLKTKGKQILIAELVLIIWVVFLYIYSSKPNIINFVRVDEALGIRIWISRISCVGVLIGSEFAHIIWIIKNKSSRL